MTHINQPKSTTPKPKNIDTSSNKNRSTPSTETQSTVPSLPNIQETSGTAQRSLQHNNILMFQRMIGNQAIIKILNQPHSPENKLINKWELEDHHESSSTPAVIQREWIDDELPLKKWDQPVDGFIWYFNQDTQKMHYKLDMDKVKLPVKQRERIIKGQNQPYTHQEWLDAGWGKGNGQAPLKVQDQAKTPKNYAGTTTGIEVENPSAYKLQLGEGVARGVIGWVETGSAEKLAELTTDMGSNPYTIELRTLPVVEEDQAGVTARKAALQLLTEAITEAGSDTPSRSVTEKTKGDLKIVIPTVTKKHTVLPAKSDARPGVQITKGLAWSDMVKDAPAKKGVFEYASATWMRYFPIYNAHFTTTYKDKAEGMPEVFGMLASLIRFYMDKIDMSRIKYNLNNPTDRDKEEAGAGGRGVIDGELKVRPDLVDPNEKNAWGLLPKTPPARWLDGLTAPEYVTLVKKALREDALAIGAVNKTAWNTILREILGGAMIAGHAVPDFKIKDETGFAFEIRTPKKNDKSFYGY